ncbi:MAG: FAD-dependent oxidoreductase [Nitrospinota bacterium]|nr:MAG: FAD-dependent oxidoreductase [Nitrospinota bacterium]
MKTVELAIVGGGPAGLCAAMEAARAGVEVLIIDENRRIGGQIYRQIPYRVTDGTKVGKDYQKAQELFQAVEALPNVSILSEATVWGIFDQHMLAIYHQGRSEEVTAQALLIAAGAHDRPVPFPGWTLPGVFSAGGALTLMKSQRILPGRKVLLAGTGPLQLVVATYLLEGGAEIVAVLEASSLHEWWRQVPKLWGEWELMWEGFQYIKRLRSARVDVLRAHTICRAEGEEKVTQAVATRVDEQWRPVPGTERRFAVDAVVCGFGLVPSIELTALCGCEHQYNPKLGGWIPRYNEEMETTVPGVFVAGETAGIAGAVVAMEEGKVAGIAAARRLGHLSDDEAQKRMQPSRQRLAELYKFRAGLDELYTPREGLLDLITPETIICRCEEVPAEMISQAINEGAMSLREVKGRTRAGMGHCQGRMCTSTVAGLIARQHGVTAEAAGLPSIRPPVKPIPLAALLMEE